MYALTPTLMQTLRKGATKAHAKYLHTINYQDKMSGIHEPIVGVASADQKCASVVFDSLKDMLGPGLLRAHQEDCLAVSLQDHKLGILAKNSYTDIQPSLLLQVELNSSRARKKPLNIGDVNLVKICLTILQERLQKFVIQTQVGSSRQSLAETVAFVMRTASHECHKTLGRSL